MSKAEPTHSKPGTRAGRIAVICGNGSLPGEVIAAARAHGHDPLVIAIKGEAEAAVADGGEALWLGWGQIGKMFASMHRAGVDRVVLIGGVRQRPDFLSIVGDFGTMRRIPRILNALARGDDGVLTGIIALIEEEGFRVIGAHEIAPGMLAAAGAAGRHAAGPDHQRDLQAAIAAARALGALDVGQAAVAVNGRVIATEAAEGTDAMLRRCQELKAARRVGWRGQAGVLVKCVKPGQDLRVDLPSIGPETVARAAELGLAGIAVDAGHVLIAERQETLRRADAAGLFITGIVPPQPDSPLETADAG